jgi:hypothetical protein
MRKIHFSRPLPWTSDLYAWFTSTVRGVRFRTDIDAPVCCSPAGVINMTAGNANSLWGTSIPDPPLAAMVHEARHADGYHHDCGPLDQNAEELGAWGVQYYLLVWIALYSDLPQDQRTYALERAAELGAGVFCQGCAIPPASLASFGAAPRRPSQEQSLATRPYRSLEPPRVGNRR